MALSQHLGIADYAVIGVLFLISAIIGLKLRNRNSSKGDYFLSGRNAPMFPIVLSSSVTMLSSVLMLGIPSESYRYGPYYLIRVLPIALGQFVASRVFIPVYFQCKVSSIYELLEMRFGKYTRYSISAVFIVQTLLYMCAVLLGPVIALNSVTDFSTEIAIIAFGSICTFYCVMGGLKAVLWTDVFQAGMMFLCIIIMYAVSINEVGSLTEIVKRASAGQRLNFFDFRFDFETRYTFWNCSFRGFGFGLAFWGASQIEVQRSLSMSKCSRAQRSIQWSILPVFLLQASCNILGVLLYTVFYLCDPVLMFKNTGITKYDQLVPYFIVSRLHSFPGLTGVCIAGIFSGSLSTMSSAINSLATVTVIDFVQPTFPRLTDARTVTIGKLLGVLYGALGIGITFAIAKVDSILQATVIFVSYTEGPVLAIFLIGVLTRKASDKSAVFGLLVGVCLTTWIGFGTLFGGYRYPSLPLETSGCSMYANTTASLLNNATQICTASLNCTTKTIVESKEIFALYKIPFTWIPPLGCLATSISVLIISLILDGNKNVVPRDSKCLSPVFRYGMKYFPDQEAEENENEAKTNLKHFSLSEQTHM